MLWLVAVVSKPFILQTEAASNGIGFILSHERHGMLQPIQFGGWVLTKIHLLDIRGLVFALEPGQEVGVKNF